MINMEMHERTIGLIGDNGLKKLKGSRVAVFGVGGVGGHTAEALLRAGVGEIDLIDGDVFAVSNLNRQLFSTTKSIGRAKVDVAKERLLEIDPTAKINAHNTFFEKTTEFDFTAFDYVVDAIDTVSSKLEIVERCNEANVPIISSMGAGNKLDPTAFKIADVYDTKVCPLARVMRRECKARGIKSLKVVYSEEQPVVTTRTPASISFVPSAVGLIIASVVVKDLLK